MLQPGTVVHRLYRVERLLGEGGMGRVYLATHVNLGLRVALKELRRMSTDPSEHRRYVENFEAEARILSGLNHSNIARALDFFEDTDNPYLVMEFIEGRTLEQVMDLAGHGLTEKKVLEWADQLLSALDYLHGRTPPIILKDLNPRNIMRDSNSGVLKIIDFGLAKLMGPMGGTREIVRSMGSEGYAPLEQYGQKPTDQRGDLYALAATMYFLLTKAPPPAPPQRLMGSETLSDPRVVNPTVSQQVWTAMQLLLSIEPEDRPKSVAEARRLLGLLPRSHGAAAPPRAPQASPPRAPQASPPPPPRTTKVRPCPDCQVPLRAIRRLGVEIDVCPRCQGLWLDRGELERLMERGHNLMSGQRVSAGLRGGKKGFLDRVLDYLEKP